MLINVVERLSNATELSEITEVVAEAARALVGSDGATFVLRDEEQCYYADEAAISPLWKGKLFPLEECISGWAMLHKEVVLIPDIYRDSRIPHDAYRPTFVKSLCMVPIRPAAPVGAIGSYWAREYEPSAEQIKLLQILANSSATALENLELRTKVLRREAEREDLTNRQRELEFQLHALAHDLKSPLSTMLGCAELLQMRASGQLDNHARQYVDTILGTGDRLSRQIDRMLTLYRLSARTIERRQVDVSAIVREAVEDVRMLEPERPAEIQVTPGLTANADPDLLRLAIGNLVSNSFKFSRKKDRTFIRFDRDASNGAFVIEDHGAGFDEADAAKLFRPLSRLHGENEFPGTGLGLASVARILELHGGRIWAQGKTGVGARFLFALP